MTTLAVLTCKREGADYVTRTLDRLDAQNWKGRKLLWSDGPLVERPGWESGGNPRQGPPNTFAFWDLLAVVDPGDDLLFVEDDVLPSAGALAYAARMGCPRGVAYVSWFDPICRRSNRLPRVRYFDAGEIIPCQARTFSAHTVAQLLAFRSDPRWLPGGGSDACVAAALGGQWAAVHQPSLFQHVGQESAVDPGSSLSGARIAESFLGDDFDFKVFAGITSAELFASPLVAARP
jgi:hypothetical protein